MVIQHRQPRQGQNSVPGGLVSRRWANVFAVSFSSPRIYCLRGTSVARQKHTRMTTEPPLLKAKPRGTAREVFPIFLRLGSLSFGGPIAHLGYFHVELVERRRWCDEQTFAEIVALAQSMPGPASSQVGFALGLLHAGWPGAAAAWFGFTMPSALLMLAFAFGHALLTGRTGAGVVHGLQLVAVAVVAQAIITMRRSLAPDAARMILALLAAVAVYFGVSTLHVIVAGALCGLILPYPTQARNSVLHFALSRRAGIMAATIFSTLLFLLPVTASFTHAHSLDVANAFFRTGALVFGGGHVVLPLLEHAVVARGWVDLPSFLSGYGAAQALPGPLFTFGAYLGAVIRPTPSRIAFSALALVSIFLPGLLVLVAVLPFWNGLRQLRQIRSILRGINATVVGVLIAAFIHPVWSSAVHSFFDLGVALAAFALLTHWRLPSWLIVLLVASLSGIASAV